MRIVYIRNNTIYFNGCTKDTNNVIIHYGVKGMKWGVRKSSNKSGPLKMNLQLFGGKASSRKSVNLSAREYAHVMSELRTHITAEEKTHAIVRKAIGDFIYSFENHFDDTYRVIGKKRIPNTMTGLLERINDGK